MVTILMISAKMATLDLLKIKVFLNHGHDVINLRLWRTQNILSHDSIYVVNVAMWPKLGNSRTSVREVIITSIL